MKEKFNKLMLSLMEPIAKFIAIFHKPDTRLEDHQLDELKRLLEDGDILVSRTYYELSNVFMPGHWKHVAIYKNGMIYEAVTKEGARKTTLEEFFFKKDEIGLCRWPGVALPEQWEMGHSYLEAKLGEKYDWDFIMNDQARIYCSEYAYFFLSVVFGDTFTKLFIKSKYFGEYIIRPTDVWNNLTQIKTWK